MGSLSFRRKRHIHKMLFFPSTQSLKEFKTKVDSGNITIVNVVKQNTTNYNREIPPCVKMVMELEDMKHAKNLSQCHFITVTYDDGDSKELVKHLKVLGNQSMYPLVKIFEDKEEVAELR